MTRKKVDPEDDFAPIESEPDTQQQTTERLIDIACRFLEGFKRGGNYIYQDRINIMAAQGSQAFMIDYADFEEYTIQDPDFDAIIKGLHFEPGRTIGVLKGAVVHLLKRSPNFDESSEDVIKIRLKNIPNEVEIPDIKAEQTGQIFSLMGIVNMMEKQQPLVIRAAYRCSNCNAVTFSQDTSFLTHKEVKKCSACDDTAVFLDETRSKKITYQRISIQQLHERVEPGITGTDIECWMTGDDLINSVRPGERVKIVGIVRLKPTKKNSLFEFYVDTNYIQSVYDEELTAEEAKWEELVKKAIRPEQEDRDFNKLMASMSPTIKGEDYIKCALLLQSVGSEAMIMPDGSRLRGDVNLLLCGDAGSGKTTMMRFVKRLHKRAVYVNGRGFTKAGLTAAVISDDGIPRIHAGAYLQADKSIVIVDEVDKTSPEDREVLPGLMDDQQTFSLNKWGINKDMQVRAASLHGGNPIDGKWDETKTLQQNLPFAFWLFDRYDLKFVMKNIPDQARDKDIANHFSALILNSIAEKSIEKREKQLLVSQDFYPVPFMKAWITFVKKNFDPQLTADTMKAITDFYLSLRKDEDTQNITMREMGALIRLSRASARAHMRTEVNLKDVSIGADLIIESFKSFGINPVTGRIDTSLINNTGKSKRSSDYEQMWRLVKSLAGGSGHEEFSEKVLMQTAVKFMSDKKAKENLALMRDVLKKLLEVRQGWLAINNVSSE